MRHSRSRQRAASMQEQRHFEFLGQEEIVAPLEPGILCDALVAPVSLRFRAGLTDALIMSLGCGVVFGLFYYAGGRLPADKHGFGFLTAALVAIPVVYKLLWTFVGQDTIGMQSAGLRLVDFDGNPPSKQRRYQRFFGALISFLAAGMGVVWAFVDEDSLTWHDHMSGTFPTVASDS
ncbi:MAG: RDD family protein [Acidobacteriaceae bacterium]|nr:RDD family protein [Acidobacteriaceae bacterium]